MGYGVMPYRVKTTKIAELFGSKTQGLTTKLKNRIEQLDDNFEPEYGWPPMEQLLEQFLNGDAEFFSFDGNSAKHWYTIELLLWEYGEMLSNGNWYPGGNINPFYSAKAFRMYAIDKENKLNLASPDDFPCLFTIHNENLEEAAATAADISDNDQRQQFLQWIDEAKKHGEDLMLFYY